MGQCDLLCAHSAELCFSQPWRINPSIVPQINACLTTGSATAAVDRSLLSPCFPAARSRAALASANSLTSSWAAPAAACGGSEGGGGRYRRFPPYLSAPAAWHSHKFNALHVHITTHVASQLHYNCVCVCVCVACTCNCSVSIVRSLAHPSLSASHR